MKASAEIYRLAARLIERGEEDYACNAIYRAAHPRLGWTYPAQRDRHPLVLEFTINFKPERTDGEDAWYGLSTEENRAARILALCLSADITERP